MDTEASAPAVELTTRASHDDTAANAVQTGIRRVWWRTLIFLTPPALLVCIPIWLVDPFQVLHAAAAPDALRTYYALRTNGVLLRLAAFSRHPSAYIVLGGSQVERFDEAQIQHLSGQPYAKLSYDGSSLAELAATFWYAAGAVPLKQVYVNLNFLNYTDMSRNRAPDSLRIIGDPLYYFVSGDARAATWAYLQDRFLHHPTIYRRYPKKEVWWQESLDRLAQRKLARVPPDADKEEFRKIGAYCRARGIAMHFIVAPEHMDVRRRIHDEGMDGQYAQFLDDIQSFGPVYDCNIPSEITSNADNFFDPYHLTEAVAARVAPDIWGQAQQFCRLLPQHAAAAAQ